MALGQHLVRELGLVDSTDTLARWLAHEVAEAIANVERAKTARQRSELRGHALELIITLWKHREQLPGGAYPLARLREVIRTLSLFSDDPNRPWWGYNRGDQAEAAIFHAFTRLMPSLLLLGSPSATDGSAKGSAAYDSLVHDERAVVDSLRVWLDSAIPSVPTRGAGSTRGKRVKVTGPPKRTRDVAKDRSNIKPEELELRVRETALAALSELEEGLASIRARIEQRPPAGKPSSSQTELQ